MMELMALAIETDSTRIMTLSSGFANGDFGLQEGYHGFSHHGERPDHTDALKKIELSTKSRQMAYLIDLLKEKEDPINGGTLFDHTMILFGCGMATGTHSCKNMPLVLAGGGFKLGEHVVLPEGKFERVKACNLLLSMLQNFGLEVDRFGTSTGTLTGRVKVGLGFSQKRGRKRKGICENTRSLVLILLGLASLCKADPKLEAHRPFLKTHCFECHGPEKQKGEFRFDTLGTDLSELQTLEGVAGDSRSTQPRRDAAEETTSASLRENRQGDSGLDPRIATSLRGAQEYRGTGGHPAAQQVRVRATRSVICSTLNIPILIPPWCPDSMTSTVTASLPRRQSSLPGVFRTMKRRRGSTTSASNW